MFANYCTSCHGTDGKGYGPVTVSRSVPPIDLTVLSRKNHGTFPQVHVVHVLKYGAAVPSHTSVEMPVWGLILGKINLKDPREGQLRIRSLSGFLETIQVK
jgi:mono/diheme cytochrome c family protein